MDARSRDHGPNRRILLLGVWMLLGLLLLGAIPLSNSLTTIGPIGGTTSSSSNAPSVAPATGLPTPIQHVIVSYFENYAYSSVMNNTFFASMANSYSGATKFYAECHPSSGNYVSYFTDRPLNCGTDNVNNYSVNSLAQELDNAGRSWITYAQDAPSNCYLKDDGSVYYWAHHIPAAYVSYVRNSTSYCDSHIVTINSDRSPPAWNTSAPPAFSQVQQGKGVYGLNTAAAWAQYDYSLWSTKSWWSSTVWFLVFDESVTSDTACPGIDNLTGSCGGHVYVTAVGPYNAGVGAYTTTADHFSLYQTITWLEGTAAMGTGTAMKSMFDFANHVPTKYSVTGTVSNATGTAISGAQIYANNSTASLSTTTSSSGSFSFSLTNGSYGLTALASGYVAQSQTVKVSGAALSGVDFSLAAVPGTPASDYAVGGSVFDSSTSGPIGNATLYANNTTASLSTTSSASGNFSFRLSNGSYRLTALAPAYGDESQNVTVAGADLSGVDFALTAVPTNQTNRTSYEVNGSVRDFSTSNPIGNATLYANASQVHLVTTTLSNGSYRFLLSNGSYAITATARGYQPVSANLTVNGASVTGADFGLIPLGLSTFTTDGTVKSGTDGTPIENATIFFTNGPATISVQTNSTGGYAVDLPNGTYNITVVATGYVSSLSQLSVQGSTASDLNFTLTPVTATWHPSGGGGIDLATPFYLSVIAGTFAAVGLSGWVLGRWVRRRPRSRGRGFWRRRK